MANPVEKKNAVVVFAKTPGWGNAKTRIAAESGRAEADRIYRELLLETACAVEDWPHFVSFDSPDGKPGDLTGIFSKASGFLMQPRAGLGERVASGIREIGSRGYTSICAIGCDCPGLGREDLMESFAVLASGCDVVVGPAQDGGYYLIGVKDPQSPVFRVQGWGTGRLLQETRRAIAKHNLKTQFLSRKSDIDTLSDYLDWKNSVQ